MRIMFWSPGKLMSQLLIATALLAAAPALRAQSDLPWVKNVGARIIPSGKTVYWVNDFGKIADSNMVISSFIQKAIDECAKKGAELSPSKPVHIPVALSFSKKEFT